MINSPSFFFKDTLSIKFGGSIILCCLWHPSPLSFFSAMGWKRRGFGGHGYVVSHPSFLNKYFFFFLIKKNLTIWLLVLVMFIPFKAPHPQ
jgi:hypothetical protein